jgi:hypothetical protein
LVTSTNMVTFPARMPPSKGGLLMNTVGMPFPGGTAEGVAGEGPIEGDMV